MRSPDGHMSERLAVPKAEFDMQCLDRFNA